MRYIVFYPQNLWRTLLLYTNRIIFHAQYSVVVHFFMIVHRSICCSENVDEINNTFNSNLLGEE